MACRTHHSLLIGLVILLGISAISVAARDATWKAKNEDMKQPEFLFNSDPGVLIPGIGRAMLPPFRIPTYNPKNGVIGYGHLPGGDDTFVPNPGFEVPNPASGGVQAPPEPHP